MSTPASKQFEIAAQKFMLRSHLKPSQNITKSDVENLIEQINRHVKELQQTNNYINDQYFRTKVELEKLLELF